MTDLEAAWLAGILEGEAWFGRYKNGHGNRLPIISVSMADRDVIDRVAALLGSPAYAEKRRAGRKVIYRARSRGGTARAVMEAVLPYMGARRTEQIRELLSNRPPSGTAEPPTRRSTA